MSESHGGLVGRTLSWVGVATVFSALALAVDAFAVGFLRTAGAPGGSLWLRGASLRPTTILGSFLFVAVAAVFLLACTRSGLPPSLVASAMAAAVICCWSWAALSAYDRAVLHPDLGLAAWTRYSAPIGLASTIGIVVGLVLGLILSRARATGRAAGI